MARNGVLPPTQKSMSGMHYAVAIPFHCIYCNVYTEASVWSLKAGVLGLAPRIISLGYYYSLDSLVDLVKSHRRSRTRKENTG